VATEFLFLLSGDSYAGTRPRDVKLFNRQLSTKIHAPEENPREGIWTSFGELILKLLKGI
jgi:hypothetical protein